jgi:NAD(P)-dependent dehydrogenase (short-subunit alcohol dehydrogenase family)
MPNPDQPDPRRSSPTPPFEEPTQPPTGDTQRMRSKPDHGEASYRGLGRLQDREALVTGADSGIGRADALAFAREGADVAISYLQHHEDAQETLRLVESSGRRGLTLKGDLAEDAHCARLVRETLDRLGRIDVLVNNAAFQGKAVERFEDLSAERVLHTFRVNIVAMFNLVRHALPQLRPGASIINVASIQAYQPKPAILDYAATKAAIVAFTQGLAKELIERGIRVNCVAPGPVWTPLVPQSFGEEKTREHGRSSPIGRPAQPAEVAPAFVFLASDESRYVNGEILGVTGGQTLG